LYGWIGWSQGDQFLVDLCSVNKLAGSGGLSAKDLAAVKWRTQTLYEDRHRFLHSAKGLDLFRLGHEEIDAIKCTWHTLLGAFLATAQLLYKPFEQKPRVKPWPKHEAVALELDVISQMCSLSAGTLLPHDRSQIIRGVHVLAAVFAESGKHCAELLELKDVLTLALQCLPARDLQEWSAFSTVRLTTNEHDELLETLNNQQLKWYTLLASITGLELKGPDVAGEAAAAEEAQVAALETILKTASIPLLSSTACTEF
jgi:hypothetical protein